MRQVKRLATGDASSADRVKKKQQNPIPQIQFLWSECGPDCFEILRTHSASREESNRGFGTLDDFTVKVVDHHGTESIVARGGGHFGNPKDPNRKDFSSCTKPSEESCAVDNRDPKLIFPPSGETPLCAISLPVFLNSAILESCCRAGFSLLLPAAPLRAHSTEWPSRQTLSNFSESCSCRRLAKTQDTHHAEAHVPTQPPPS